MTDKIVKLLTSSFQDDVSNFFIVRQDSIYIYGKDD